MSEFWYGWRYFVKWTISCVLTNLLIFNKNYLQFELITILLLTWIFQPQNWKSVWLLRLYIGCNQPLKNMSPHLQVSCFSEQVWWCTSHWSLQDHCTWCDCYGGSNNLYSFLSWIDWRLTTTSKHSKTL